MRTTLNIDDDVLMMAKEMSDQQGLSTGAVLSQLARKGLRMPTSQPSQPSDVPNDIGFYPFAPHPNGRIVTAQDVSRVRDELGI